MDPLDNSNLCDILMLERALENEAHVSPKITICCCCCCCSCFCTCCCCCRWYCWCCMPGCCWCNVTMLELVVMSITGFDPIMLTTLLISVISKYDYYYNDVFPRKIDSLFQLWWYLYNICLVTFKWCMDAEKLAKLWWECDVIKLVINKVMTK